MKKIFTILALICFSIITFSQPFKEKREKVKALKVAFITEKLKLTTDEAQKFWPIYNTFDEKQFEIKHHKLRSIMNQIEGEGIENVSEKQAQNLITEMVSSEDELHNLRKKFIQDVQKVLPAKKVVLLRKTEEEFNRKLLKELRGRRP